jgi:MFS superfamily sulfate permease-like transporter
VFTIAIGLVDLKRLGAIRRESPGEFWLATGTAATVVLFSVKWGIILATGLSLLRHVRHSYQPHTAVLALDASGQRQMVPTAPGVQLEPGLVVYHFGADLFYANEARFADEVHRLVGNAPTPVRWLMVNAAAMTNIDYSAAQTVRDMGAQLAREGVGFVFARVSPSLRADMDRHGITAPDGVARAFPTLHEALAFVRSGPPPTQIPAPH